MSKMDQPAVNAAVIEAVRTFGLPYQGPIESAAVNHAGPDRYTAVFNDLRKSKSSGPVFWCDIEISAASTAESVRDFVKEKIAAYIANNPN